MCNIKIFICYYNNVFKAMYFAASSTFNKRLMKSITNLEFINK